jgi:hypothetical protein
MTNNECGINHYSGYHTAYQTSQFQNNRRAAGFHKLSLATMLTGD